MTRNIAVGVGLMEYPFETSDGFWRWVDLCEQGGLDSIWQRAMRRALDKGLLKERFTEHDIRAKTLTDADEQGQDAQRLAGHKSRAMTDRYIKTRRIEKVKPLARNI